MIRLKALILLFKILEYSLQDGNGYIDRRELAHMMRFIGEPVSQEEIDVSWEDLQDSDNNDCVQDILDEADKDQNGLIDYKEFPRVRFSKFMCDY